MCGLVGIVNKENGKFPVDLLRSLMIEAQIRGQHATGIAYSDGMGLLKVHIEPNPAGQFEVPDGLYDATMAIVHTRYSTSDLQYNQPNFDCGIALIHNGVVTQSEPDTWKDEFGVNCGTKNDSEILLRKMIGGVHPLTLENTSQACIAIDASLRKFSFWRNEQRPLYYVNNDDFLVVASTKDILKRAGLGVYEIHQCECCVDYTYRYPISNSLTKTKIRLSQEDLQPGT